MRNDRTKIDEGSVLYAKDDPTSALWIGEVSSLAPPPPPSTRVRRLRRKPLTAEPLRRVRALIWFRLENTNLAGDGTETKGGGVSRSSFPLGNDDHEL
jgi:hypothetical protein